MTEEALEHGKGHWPSYIGGIAEGLRAAGDQVDVLAHSDAKAELLAMLEATPWFRRNCWIDPRSQGAIGGIRHNFFFRADLSRWLRSHEPYDWVCALTMRLQHLLAFALLSRSASVPRETRFLLLFVQGFGLYAGHGKPTTFPKTSSNCLARFCFRLLAPAVRSGRVVLAAETRGMQDELQRFTGLPVSLFPHPVESGHGSQESEDGGQEEKLKAEILKAEMGNQKTKDQGPRTKEQAPLTVTCPGFARHEKGNDLLQEAIKKILVGPEGDRFHFVMQWLEPFAMPDGSMLGPDPALVGNSRVEFLNHSLDGNAYEALLARTDLVILPYRRSSYHHRVSRVAIEAASRGIPLLYTAGTWTGEIAELAGCGVAIRDETVEALTEALKAAATEFPALTEIARANADQVADYHSAARFRRLILQATQS